MAKRSDNFWGDTPIYSYTRTQAIDDGVLIDVTQTAHEAGIRLPTVVSQNLWANYITPSAADKRNGQDTSGRLWDVLWMAYNAMRQPKNASKSRLTYSVVFTMNGRQKTVELILACGPGDQGEPVLTIMLPEDD